VFNPNFLELYNAKILLIAFSKEVDGNGLKYLLSLKSLRNCQKLDSVMILNNLWHFILNKILLVLYCRPRIRLILNWLPILVSVPVAFYVSKVCHYYIGWLLEVAPSIAFMCLNYFFLLLFIFLKFFVNSGTECNLCKFIIYKVNKK
jgi:hypothetical protein